MMLIRYLSQIGKYFLMLKEIFNKQTKWPVMKNLILLFLFTFSFTAFSQDHSGSCAARKSAKGWQTKSASLTVAEIAEIL